MAFDELAPPWEGHLVNLFYTRTSGAVITDLSVERLER